MVLLLGCPNWDSLFKVLKNTQNFIARINNNPSLWITSHHNNRWFKQFIPYTVQIATQDLYLMGMAMKSTPISYNVPPSTIKFSSRADLFSIWHKNQLGMAKRQYRLQNNSVMEVKNYLLEQPLTTFYPM